MSRKLLLLALALVPLLLAVAAVASTPTTTPTSAAVKVAAAPMNLQAVPPFDDVGSAAVSATFACAATPPAVAMDATTKALLGANLTTGTTPTPMAASRGSTSTLVATDTLLAADTHGPPVALMDTRTGANTLPTQEVATTSPPRDALVATITRTADEGLCMQPPRHENGTARMDYGLKTLS